MEPISANGFRVEITASHRTGLGPFESVGIRTRTGHIGFTGTQKKHHLGLFRFFLSLSHG
ncbi:MAG: hypothetical protein AMXMBFR84_26370 [Candidatus Hydrogenedentota bacterium]